MFWHITWLENAVSKARKNTYGIDGNITIEEFIKIYLKEETDKIIIE